MSDGGGPPKKVVKRVVKKTVVRPVPHRSAHATATARPTGGAPAAKAATKPAQKAPPKPTRTPRPSPEIGRRASAVGAAVRERGSQAFDATRSGASTVYNRAREATDHVLAWRLPHWPPVRASAVAGAVSGLVSVLLGAAFLQLFSVVRGVSAGGRWGIVSFVVVVAVTIVIGDRLLAGFDHPQPRLVATLGVAMTVMVILIFLLGVTQTIWALIALPIAGGLMFVAAHHLIEFAENAPLDE